MLQQLAEGHVGRPLEADQVLASAVLDHTGEQKFLAPPVLETDLQRPLLPLLQVAHDAAPDAPALHGEGALVVGRRMRFEAEHLDARPRRLVHDDAGADHLRVVEHEQRTGRKRLVEPSETALGNLSIPVNQQFRGRTFGQRKLGDPLVGERIVVVVDSDRAMFHSGCKGRNNCP